MTNFEIQYDNTVTYNSGIVEGAFALRRSRGGKMRTTNTAPTE